MYDSFCSYQAALLAEFDRLGEEYKFETVDGSAEAKLVFTQLQTKILRILESDSRKVFLPKLFSVPTEGVTRRTEETLIPAVGDGSTKDVNVMSRPTSTHGANGNSRFALPHK
jgi:hypothetical protein